MNNLALRIIVLHYLTKWRMGKSTESPKGIAIKMVQFNPEIILTANYRIAMER